MSSDDFITCTFWSLSHVVHLRTENYAAVFRDTWQSCWISFKLTRSNCCWKLIQGLFYSFLGYILGREVTAGMLIPSQDSQKVKGRHPGSLILLTFRLIQQRAPVINQTVISHPESYDCGAKIWKYSVVRIFIKLCVIIQVWIFALEYTVLKIVRKTTSFIR